MVNVLPPGPRLDVWFLMQLMLAKSHFVDFMQNGTLLGVPFKLLDTSLVFFYAFGSLWGNECASKILVKYKVLAFLFLPFTS